ncbi:inorganic phosphate transporter [Brevibacterium litoralis]|uniref:inorganic phosphate transporter n=1 Tax=Brevibacterium litoralis TaxID=3138935 RepID=UPI0032ECC88E
MEFLLVLAVLAALGFTFVNGFHDMGVTVANAVSARALEPRAALWLTVSFNFIGALIGQSLAVVFADYIVEFPAAAENTLLIISVGLIAGGFFNVLTYLWRMPVSSTHCMIGGLLGAGLTLGGHVEVGNFAQEILAPLLIAPILAFAFSFVLMAVVSRFVGSEAPKPLYRMARTVDSVLAGGLALAHGVQSAGKTAALVLVALMTYTAGHGVNPSELTIPWWLRIVLAVVLAAGTARSGWRIVHMLGRTMTRMDPVRSLVSDITSTSYLLMAAFFQSVPASLSYTVTAANLGTQFIGGRTGVRMRYAIPVLATWVLCIPICMVIAAVPGVLLHTFVLHR